MRSTRQRCNWNAVFRQITWSSVLQATIREHAHLVFDSGRDVEPVELTRHKIADMIVSLSLQYQPSRWTHDAIQFTDELRRRSIQQTVTVIQSGQYERPNKCMARIDCQRTSDRTELTKLKIRRPDELWNLTGEHEICVNRDAETSNVCWCHNCTTVYCHWWRCWDIGQSSRWSEPYHFRFGWIEAQSIRCHPRANPLHTGTETRAQSATVTRQTVLI